MSEHFNLPPLHTSQADFAAIRSRNGFYVDKTRFFGDLLAVDGDWNHLYNAPPSLHHSHLFMARPRRFGKTLLLDTLETWFQGLPPEHPASVAGKAGQDRAWQYLSPTSLGPRPRGCGRAWLPRIGTARTAGIPSSAWT